MAEKPDVFQITLEGQDPLRLAAQTNDHLDRTHVADNLTQKVASRMLALVERFLGTRTVRKLGPNVYGKYLSIQTLDFDSSGRPVPVFNIRDPDVQVCVVYIDYATKTGIVGRAVVPSVLNPHMTGQSTTSKRRLVVVCAFVFQDWAYTVLEGVGARSEDCHSWRLQNLS